MKTTIPQRLMSKEDLADYLNISVAQVDRLRGAGAIKATRVGGSIRFRPEHIAAYLSANEEKRATSAPDQTEAATKIAA